MTRLAFNCLLTLLLSFCLACQQSSSQTRPPVGPTATGQPGHWTGPLAQPASPAQRVSARLVPFWYQGKAGLMTPAGQVVVPATYPGLPTPLDGHRHLWAAPLTGAGPLRLALLGEDGQERGRFVTVGSGEGWGWVQAKTAQGTLTLFDSLGHLLRATPYGKLEHKSEGLVVAALPDSAIGSHGEFREGRRGMLDSQAREVIPTRYDYLLPFDHGYAYALINGKTPAARRVGVLDHQGQAHWLAPQWAQARLRYEGGFFAGWSNEQHAVVALSVDNQVLLPYSAGLSYIGREEFKYTGLLKVKQYIHLDGGRGIQEAIGFYDTLFQVVVPPTFQRIPEIRLPWLVVEGFTPAVHPLYVDDPPRGAMWRGRVVLPATNGRASITKDNRFAISATLLANNQLAYVVSEQGQPPISLLAGMSQVRYVGHGIFAGHRSSGWGLFRANGQVLRDFQDENPTEQLQAGLYYSRGPHSWGPDLCDTLGRPVVPPGRYEVVHFATPDLAWVKQQGKYGVLSRAHGLLVPATLAEEPTIQRTGSFWARTEGLVLYSPDGQEVIRLAAPDFMPTACVGPNLLLGRSGGEPALYNRQGQLLSKEVTEVEGIYRDGVIWARNVQGRYALLDVLGRQLTPFNYQLTIDLHENYFPFFHGLGLARDNSNRYVWVDCRGHEYAW
jgi:hypothetical protein